MPLAVLKFTNAQNRHSLISAVQYLRHICQSISQKPPNIVLEGSTILRILQDGFVQRSGVPPVRAVNKERLQQDRIILGRQACARLCTKLIDDVIKDGRPPRGKSRGIARAPYVPAPIQLT